MLAFLIKASVAALKKFPEFNASLDGNVRRAIDIREGETPDAEAFRALVRAAVALNVSTRAGKKGAGRAP